MDWHFFFLGCSASPSTAIYVSNCGTINKPAMTLLWSADIDVSTVITGIYGYTVKRLLFQIKDAEGVEREKPGIGAINKKIREYSIMKDFV